MALAIEGVDSSATSLGRRLGLGDGPDPGAGAPGLFDELDDAPATAPATVILGPITAPLVPVADYIRDKDRARAYSF